MAIVSYRSSLPKPTSPEAKAQGQKQDLAQTWDQHIITSIWQSLHPHNAPWLSQWLGTTANLSSQQRLIQFADDLLLSDLCEGPLLICFDSIDGLADSPCALNELLAWIAHCYELRDTYLTYRHLSIVAFGTAIPSSFSSNAAQNTQASSAFESVASHRNHPDISIFKHRWLPQSEIQHAITYQCDRIALAVC